MKKILFTLAAVATVLSGCNRTEVETSGREGLLQLQIGYSGYYNDKTPELVPVRSAADDQAFIDTFIISIDKISGTSSTTKKPRSLSLIPGLTLLATF